MKRTSELQDQVSPLTGELIRRDDPAAADVFIHVSGGHPTVEFEKAPIKQKKFPALPFSDFDMPGMDGGAFANGIKKYCPSTPVVIMIDAGTEH